ncbi:MAG: hypothetical protein EOP48_15805 [Sphingobacteriales bacterium]|nr:MAG: hypothetical protein EOP48_15805 [Sphingobacteriales bacterium]
MMLQEIYYMQYSKYRLSTPDPSQIKEILNHCPYGILHVRCQDSGDRVGVLVEVFYAEETGLSCRIAHSEKDMLNELCNEPVSLKLCNREKNIYVVADVDITPEEKRGFFSKDKLKLAITRLNFFRKNNSQQIVAMKH